MSKTFNELTEKRTYLDANGVERVIKSRKTLIVDRVQARMKKYASLAWEFKIKSKGKVPKITLKKLT
jgi:hypothetical protein